MVSAWGMFYCMAIWFKGNDPKRFTFRHTLYRFDVLDCYGLLVNALGFKARILRPGCDGFLRFTSGVTPADLLVASMVAKPFSIHLLAHTVVLEKDER